VFLVPRMIKGRLADGAGWRPALAQRNRQRLIIAVRDEMSSGNQASCVALRAIHQRLTLWAKSTRVTTSLEEQEDGEEH